jgi:hypothetical protein
MVPTVLFLLVAQASAANAPKSDSLPKDAEERCEVVTAILGARFGTAQDRWYAPSVDQPCALKNGYHEGEVLVHATIQKRLGERRSGQAFLRPLVRCGGKIVSMPPTRLPAGLKKLVNIVFVELVPDRAGGFNFYEHLQPVDSSDPAFRKGTIGTSCLPAWRGVAKRENGRWIARLIPKEPWVEPTSSGSAERLKDWQDKGIAPKIWPPPDGGTAPLAR